MRFPWNPIEEEFHFLFCCIAPFACEAQLSFLPFLNRLYHSPRIVLCGHTAASVLRHSSCAAGVEMGGLKGRGKGRSLAPEWYREVQKKTMKQDRGAYNTYTKHACKFHLEQKRTKAESQVLCNCDCEWYLVWRQGSLSSSRPNKAGCLTFWIGKKEYIICRILCGKQDPGLRISGGFSNGLDMGLQIPGW